MTLTPIILWLPEFVLCSQIQLTNAPSMTLWLMYSLTNATPLTEISAIII